MFTIDSEAFRRDLKRMGAAFETNAHDALKRTTTAAATYAKLSSLYKSHTYGLRNSIREGSVSTWTSQVSANAKYAGYVENGTPPHEIVPSRKRALRFIQNGEVRFASRVFHPGTKPRPYMAEAAHKAEPIFDRLCREAVDRAFT